MSQASDATQVPATVEREFLDYSIKKLEQCWERIETCIGKLTYEQIWMRGGEHQNAAGNLVLHLTGNLRQWILSGVAGEPNHRNRDGEFAARDGDEAGPLIIGLRTALDETIRAIDVLPPERLTERISVQGHDVTVLEAIYHVVEHFSGHTGQIIFLTKAVTGEGLGFYSYLSQPGAGAGKTP